MHMYKIKRMEVLNGHAVMFGHINNAFNLILFWVLNHECVWHLTSFVCRACSRRRNVYWLSRGEYFFFLYFISFHLKNVVLKESLELFLHG